MSLSRATHRLIALAAASAALVSAPALSADYNWRMQAYTGPEFAQLFEGFAEEVERESDGRIRIEVFEGGELVPNDEILSSVGAGLLQLGHGNGAYWSGAVELAQIESGLPGAWTSLEEAHTFWFDKGFQDLLVEAYAGQGVHYLAPLFGSAQELLAKKPVGTLEEMQQTTIRAGSAMAAVLAEVGVPTIFVPAEEIYVALSTNAAGGVIYGDAYVYDLMKLQEVARYYIPLGLTNPGYADNLLINQGVWDGLPEDLKQVVDTASQNLARAYHETMSSGSDEVLQRGVFETVELAPEATAALRAAAAERLQAQKEKGPLAARAVELLDELAAERDQ